MAKTSKSEFKFRKSDTIGAASAEDDAEFLEACFVETDEFDILKDIERYCQMLWMAGSAS